LEALGNIAGYYAYLESTIEVTIWAFLGLDYQDGSAVTTEMGAISRAQLLSMLANRHMAHDQDPNGVRAHLLDMLVHIDRVRVRRNTYIHAFWRHEKRKSAPYIENLKRSAKGKLAHTHQKIALNDLRGLTCEIKWLTDGLQYFVEFVFPDAYIPWPTTPKKPAPQKTD
jgi:hypothetical protein